MWQFSRTSLQIVFSKSISCNEKVFLEQKSTSSYRGSIQSSSDFQFQLWFCRMCITKLLHTRCLKAFYLVLFFFFKPLYLKACLQIISTVLGQKGMKAMSYRPTVAYIIISYSKNWVILTLEALLIPWVDLMIGPTCGAHLSCERREHCSKLYI